jgi:hypothetical protein
MNSATEHHAKAEQLLDQAQAEEDSFRRAQILAEAQVHAILALSAPAERSPGQDEAADTQSTETARQDMPEGSGPFEIQPHSSSARIRRGGWDPPVSPETATRKSPDRGSRGRGTGGPRIRETGKRTPTEKTSVRPPAVPRGDTAPSPPGEDPDPEEQESGLAGQSPAAGSPGDQRPGDFTF